LLSLIQSVPNGWNISLWSLITNQNIIYSLFNSFPLFQEAGLRLCVKKSRWVRINKLWIRPYTSLGLKLTTPFSLMKQLLYLIQLREIPLELSGHIRGRGSNPSKQTSGSNEPELN
jgi:hypothetical protein